MEILKCFNMTVINNVQFVKVTETKDFNLLWILRGFTYMIDKSTKLFEYLKHLSFLWILLNFLIIDIYFKN